MHEYFNATDIYRQALIEAWKAACKVYGATVEIPSGLNFLLRPVTLQGPCMPHLILQVLLSSLVSSITHVSYFSNYIKVCLMYLQVFIFLSLHEPFESNRSANITKAAG